MRAVFQILLVLMLVVQACEPSTEGLMHNRQSLDSLDAVITDYYLNPNHYDKEQFLDIHDQLKRLDQSGTEGTQVPLLVTSGLLAFMDVQQEDAIDLYLDALKIAELNNQSLYKAILHQEIAKIHFGMKSTDKALAYESKAGQAWLDLGLDDRNAHSNNYQGMMRTQLEDYDGALINFNTSYTYFQSQGDTRGMLPTLDQMAKTYFNMGESELAFEYLEEAHQFAMGLEPIWRIKTIHGLAVGYRRMGDLEAALMLFKEAFQLSKKVDVSEAILLETEVGKLYLELKNYKMAKTHLENALYTSQNAGLNHLELDLRTLLSTLYEQTQDFKAAYKHLKAFVPIHDAINAQNNEDTMGKITSEHESALKDDRLKIQEAVIQSQKLYQKIQVFSIVALLIIVILVVWNLRQKRKANAKINAQKETISQSLVEKESLIKEIHHRVKNNLQIIANLLYLQSNKSDDINIKNVLEEGQGRVRSMALIHQKLYENDDLKSIPFGEYILELINEIKMSFGEQAVDVRIKVDAQEAFFDVDSAVPLGLIINELSTNAFKYAFEGRDDGQFNIFLTRSEEGYELHVSDNGKGIPDEIDIRKTRSLGLRLVRILSEQLEGEYTFENREGMSFKLKFAA